MENTELRHIGRFLGPEEILNVEVKDDNIVTVTTKSGEETRRHTLTRFGLDTVATDEAKDWNYVQDARFTPLIAEFTRLCVEMGIKGGELEPLLRQVGRNITNLMDKAVYIKWHGSAVDFVPDGNPLFDFLVTEADKIVK